MVLHGWRWRSENYGVSPAPSVDPLMHNGRACTSLTMTLTLSQTPNPFLTPPLTLILTRQACTTLGCTDTFDHKSAMVR